MARWSGVAVIFVAWLATSCVIDRDAPQTQLSSEKSPTAKLLVVDPLGATIGPRRAPDMRVYVDGMLVRAERTGELYFPKTDKPYTVSVRFESADRRQSLFFNWIGLTSPAPRVAVRSEVAATQAVNASVRLVDERGAPYVLGANRRLLFAFEDPTVEIAYLNRSNWKADEEDGLIHLSALSYVGPIAHLEGPLHVIEMSEVEELPNVPQWIFATGLSERTAGLIQTVVMKPAEEHVLVTPKVVGEAPPSSINIMLRPPTFGMTRVKESVSPFPPPLSLLPMMIALPPPQSGLLTTIVAEAKLPGGGIGRSWQSNIDRSTVIEPLVIPQELTLIAPLDHETDVKRSDHFEWKASPTPQTIYLLTASCTSAIKQLYTETFTTSTSVPINEASSYDCDWRVQTINARETERTGMSIDNLATTDGWQARQFEENKFDSGSTSISATRHFGKR